MELLELIMLKFFSFYFGVYIFFLLINIIHTYSDEYKQNKYNAIKRGVNYKGVSFSAMIAMTIFFMSIYFKFLY